MIFFLYFYYLLLLNKMVFSDKNIKETNLFTLSLQS